MPKRDGMTSLEDFGVVDGKEVRFKQYVAAASKLDPRVRAAWWRDRLQKDPELLEFFRGDGGGTSRGKR
jgi:hypothetical protein